MLEGIRDRTIWFYLLVLNFRNIIFKVPRKKGKKMKQNKKQLFAILLITAIISGFITYTIYSIKQTLSNEKDENKPRTTYTTEQLPDETYRNPETLHILFEKMSGLQLDNEVQEKKLTVYNYKFTPDDANQDSDIFLKFGKKLQENGYDHISETADSDGYKNQFELYYDKIHFMIYTESSPDTIKLSILNYNDNNKI